MAGSIVALAAAIVAGLLREWIWVPGLEPLALGVVIGESAATPSSARGQRPPRWSYSYVFAIALLAYLGVHISFWGLSTGFPPDQSLLAFLRSSQQTGAIAFLQGSDVDPAAAPAGVPLLKYSLWVAEALLMGASAGLAYRAGSVRKLQG